MSELKVCFSCASWTSFTGVVKPCRGRGWWMRGWSGPSHPVPGAVPAGPGGGREGGEGGEDTTASPISPHSTHKTNAGFQNGKTHLFLCVKLFYKSFKYTSESDWAECEQVNLNNVDRRDDAQPGPVQEDPQPPHVWTKPQTDQFIWISNLTKRQDLMNFPHLLGINCFLPSLHLSGSTTSSTHTQPLHRVIDGAQHSFQWCKDTNT